MSDDELKFMSQFKAAERPAAVVLPPQSSVDIDALKKQASENGMRTLKIHLDLSALLQPLGPHKVMRFNPLTRCLDVVCQLTEDDTYPEPAAFSRSSAVIVWRQMDSRPVEVVLVKERNANRVSFVAGGQKAHESSLAGAIREVEEEVGLQLDLSTIKWIRTDEMCRGQGELNTLNTFSAKVADDSMKIKIQEAEILEAGWYGCEEALAACTISSARDALSAFFRQEGLPVQHNFPEEASDMSWLVAGVVGGEQQ